MEPHQVLADYDGFLSGVQLEIYGFIWRQEYTSRLFW